MKKGYVYSLEMLIAVSIIIVALVLIFREGPKEQQIEVSMLKRYGWESLEYMNYNGSLREYVANNDGEGLKNTLSDMLPRNVFFELAICKLQCDDTNVPKNKTVVTVDYYVSGYRNNFVEKKVKMWVWI